MGTGQVQLLYLWKYQKSDLKRHEDTLSNVETICTSDVLRGGRIDSMQVAFGEIAIYPSVSAM